MRRGSQTQEAPSFLVPAGLFLHALLCSQAGPASDTLPGAAASCQLLGSPPQPFAFPRAALLGAFLVHYAHRAFLYPLFVQRGGKPTPLYVWLMALAFCAYNGFLQVRPGRLGYLDI